MTRRRNLIEDERAAVYVEFIVVFWPVFILFLGTIQIGLAMAADLALQHSADQAARSAIVVLPDDPEFNGGSPKNTLNYNSTPNPGFVTSAINLIEKISDMALADMILGGDASIRFQDVAFNKGDTRLNMIRFAAFRPMLPFAPHPSEMIDPRSSIDNALKGAGARLAFGFVYNMGALAVTFPDAPGGEPQDGEVGFSGNQQLTARATYLFHCGIPFASQMMCKSAGQIHLQSAEGQNELNYAVAPAFVSVLTGASLFADRPACFLVLRREATLTYQGAAYKYRSED